MATLGRIVEEAIVLPIARENIRSEAVVKGKYIDPEHAILLSGIAEIHPQDIILTAVCWLLKWRPIEVPIQTIAIPAKLQSRATAIRLTPVSDHTIAFMAMGGLMTLAKEVRLTQPSANYEYLKLGWKALCTTLNMGNIIEQGQITNEAYMGIMQILVTWQMWIKSQGTLRRTLLNLVFERGERELFVAEILDEVQLVLKDYGLKSAYLMEDFILSGSRAILFPTILSQAVNLKKVLIDLRAKHTDTFPYLMVYPLEGAERLHHSNYPDLYYAAVCMAIKGRKLGVEDRYNMSEIQTTIPRATIKEVVEGGIYIRDIMTIKENITNEKLQSLEFLGLDAMFP